MSDVEDKFAGDGGPNDPGLKEYNIWELADKQADYLQNRQVREKEERAAFLAARKAATEPVQTELPLTGETSDDAG